MSLNFHIDVSIFRERKPLTQNKQLKYIYKWTVLYYNIGVNWFSRITNVIVFIIATAFLPFFGKNWSPTAMEIPVVRLNK